MNAGRHGAVRGDADRIARAIDDRLAGVDLAEPSVAQKLHRLAEYGAAAPLSPDLHDAVVSSCGVDHPAPFDDVVADRFLDVDVFSGLAGPNHHQRVPVIGRGDGHGIHVTVVEHAPEIGFGLRVSAELLLHDRQGAREMPFVDVHHVRDANVGDAGETMVVILAAAPVGPRRMALVVAAKADDRDVDGLVRAALCAASLRERQGESGSRRRSLGKEETPIDHLDHLVLRRIFYHRRAQPLWGRRG